MEKLFMNEIIHYLNSHYDIKNIVVVFVGEFAYEDVKKYIEGADLNKIVVAGYLSEKKIGKIIEEYNEDLYFENVHKVELSFCDLKELKEMNTDALCCENIDPNLLKNFSELRPKYLLASVPESAMSSFGIWEAYREYTKFIQVVTVRKDKEIQVLKWEKDAKTDIELSVIFPMYNVEKYLDQCIESVTAWKAPYVEFLFVNDGSPDNSREVVLKWTQKDSRVKLLDKENGGCASARQYGIEHAKGKYIGFIDPDDFIDESMYRKLLRAAMIGSYEISYCGYNEYYENTKQIRPVEDQIGAPWCYGVHDQKKIWELIAFCRVAIWRGIYKADFLRRADIHFYTDLRRFDDLPFKVETFAEAKSVISVPEHLYYYRLARPGQDVAADDERLYVHFDIFNYLNQTIAGKRNLMLTDKLQMCKIDTHLYAIEKIKPEFVQHYVSEAKKDLDSTNSFERFMPVAEMYMGHDKAIKYKKIVENDYKFFLKEKEKQNSK